MTGDTPIAHSKNLSLLAPAKVNLFLHITGRRENGYHELESLFVRTDFGDRIMVEAADTVSLTITGPFSSGLQDFPPETNIVLQAARLLQAHCEEKQGARITLEKNVPVASGIGGGSADAAATLLALKALWQMAVPMDDLMALALKLGADVPACLSSRPQWVKGVGEICQPVRLGFEAAILLVNPNVSLSTPDVFKVYKDSGVGFSPVMSEKNTLLPSLDGLAGMTHNDLYDPALAICPAIGDVIEALNDLPMQQMVAMSGSGATCFALFDTLSQAEEARRIINAAKPQWWVDSGQIIS